MSDETILGPGEHAPNFTLADLEGRPHELADALRDGPVLLAFFSLDCQACETSFVPWDKVHVAYAGERFAIWAIGLDEASRTEQFVERSGVEFPVMVDADGNLARAYRVRSTPTVVLVDQSGAVVTSHDAWDRAALNEVIGRVAEAVGEPAFEIRAKDAPEFRPGCTVHW